jgi:uncharacterized membrane protein
MITVTLYYLEQNQEYGQAMADLESLQETVPHQLATINLDGDHDLQEKVGPGLPMVEIGPYHLHSPFTRQDLQVLLSAAYDRIDQMDRAEQAAYQKRLERGHTITTGDKISGFIANHYLIVINILLAVFIGLPFLAPVLVRAGQTLPATVIYKIYSPLCHQLAFRSWFLFGEQAYYPRALAGIPNVIPYETIIHSNVIDLTQARDFIGTPATGYKVALCERDVAIYGSLLVFGLVFAATGRRMGPLPWMLWLLIGLGPIGLDGVSQLPSLINGLPAWLPIRESTPLLRTLTGGLFGWMTAWYLFPMIEKSSRETRQLLKRKLAVIGQDGLRAS